MRQHGRGRDRDRDRDHDHVGRQWRFEGVIGGRRALDKSVCQSLAGLESSWFAYKIEHG